MRQQRNIWLHRLVERFERFFGIRFDHFFRHLLCLVGLPASAPTCHTQHDYWMYRKLDIIHYAMTSPSASSAATQEKLSLPTAPERSTKREADFGSTLSTGRNLVLLQLLSRLLTFVLNQSLVRLAPPEVFGTAAIQFDLVYSTILFLSREGIRNALLRSSIWSTPLSRLPFKLGLVVSTLSIGVYLFTSDRATTGQNDFYLALGLYVLSALVELGVEPLYIRTLRSIPPKLGVRVQAEGGMAVIKALVTFTSLVLAPRRALLGFALGQLGGDVWLASRYIFEYGVSALTEG